MKIGYARVSTQEQNLDLQIEKLNAAGCETIFSEKMTGSRKDRPELEKMLSMLRAGDTVIITKLDRIGRSLKNLVEIVAKFEELKVEFISLGDTIDTTTSTGRLMFNLMASFAEFEREMIKERTQTGIARAKRYGRFAGRPKGSTPEILNKAIIAYTLNKENPNMPISEIAKRFNVSRTTIYRYFDIADTHLNENKPAKMPDKEV